MSNNDTKEKKEIIITKNKIPFVKFMLIAAVISP